MNDNRTDKKVWVTPKLIVHGDVQAITQTKYKTFGPTDDVLFCIADITIGSCPPDACP